MQRTQTPFTVHEATVAIYHAWGDGLPVGGPVERHRGMMAEFRAGMRMEQAEAAGAVPVGEVGEWRVNRPSEVRDLPWNVEFSVPLAAASDEGAAVSALGFAAGSPVVVVVRFHDRVKSLWRTFQFHDAVILPAGVGEDGQRMMRTVRVSAGWLEQFKSGTMPGMDPRLVGVIEWRHLGRVVRCHEYDFQAGTWAEDGENLSTVDDEPYRLVEMVESGGNLRFSMTAVVTEAGELGASVPATGMRWKHVLAFELLDGSSHLTLAPGWTLEANGLAEPLLLPPSGRHWEHPRVVFRVLGRTYATIRAGVIAVPAVRAGLPTPPPIDAPIRMGRLLLYPDGAWIMPGI